MILIILQALYFMLPAYVANMAPVIFQWIPMGSGPIDRRKTWRGKRIFGDHKTWRGIAVGFFGAMLTMVLQKKFGGAAKSISLLTYEKLTNSEIIMLGLAFGGGALLGDLVKSFFKRRIGIRPGQPFFPFDQLDFVIGALLAVSIFYIPPALHIFVIIILTPLLHLAVNATAYFLGLKKVWW